MSLKPTMERMATKVYRGHFSITFLFVNNLVLFDGLWLKNMIDFDSPYGIMVMDFKCLGSKTEEV